MITSVKERDVFRIIVVLIPIIIIIIIGSIVPLGT